MRGLNVHAATHTNGKTKKGKDAQLHKHKVSFKKNDNKD